MSYNLRESKQDIEIVRVIAPSNDTMIKSFAEDSPLSEYLIKTPKEKKEEAKVENKKMSDKKNAEEKEEIASA